MHINDLLKTNKADIIVEFIFYSIYWTLKYPVNWGKKNSRSFALINFKTSAMATFKLALMSLLFYTCTQKQTYPISVGSFVHSSLQFQVMYMV